MRRFLYFLVVLGVCLVSTRMWGQGIGRDITKRWDNNGQTLRGDFIQIGNHRNGSATLKIAGHSSCLRVKWAGLYWASTGSMSRQGDDSTYTATFKLPNGQSVPLRADERMTTVFGGSEFLWNSFKDVTSILQGLGAGFNNGDYQLTYSIGGWSIWNLVVVYEDVNASTSKRVYVYDGCLLNFYNYNGVQHKTIPITGFQTPPAPAVVKARIGVCTGAGNINSYDILEINGHKQGQGSYPNAYEDFMDASISFNHSEAAMPRNPVLGRGQGFADLDVFDIPNPNNTVIKNGDTSLEIHFAAEDAYITYTVPFSIDAIAPYIETHKEVLGLQNGQWKDFTGKTADFGEALKYRLKFRNIGNDNVRDAVLEDLLPKGVTYDDIEQPLPAGVTFVSATPNYNNTGRTMVKFNVDPSILPYSSSAPFSAPITFKVKVQPDCANLIDFCSNEFKNQAEMVYHAALDNKEYRTGSFATAGGACDQNNESTTTFFVKDDTCEAQDLPYCGNMVLKGGAGFGSWKWTKEGQAGVIATTQDLSISSPGVYWVERTPPAGGNRCNNKLKIKYNVQTRSGDDQHPMRDASYVTERKVCNNTGIEYLGIGVCNGTETLTITNSALTDGQVTWYKYKTQRAPGNCPPDVSHSGIQNDSNWQLVHTGKSYDLAPANVDANGSEFAVRLGYQNCPLTYHFRAYKGNVTYSVDKENIICGEGKIKVSAISSGAYQYKLKGPNGSSQYQDLLPVGTTAFDIPVTQAGQYEVYLRPKVAQYQDNVCQYKKTVDIEAVTDTDALTLTQVEAVQCVSNNPGTGKMRVVVNSFVTLPVKVVVKKGATHIVTYTVTNTTELNSDNIASVKNQLYNLVAGNDYTVTLTPTYKTGCNPTVSNFEITQIPELKINNAVAKSLTCGSEKEFSIIVQGGKLNPINGRYSFTIDGVTSNNISVNFEGKTGNPEVHTYSVKFKDSWSGTPNPKTYTINVWDQNNCKASKDVSYTYQEKPLFNLEKVADAVCGPTSGSLKITITNGNFHQGDYTIIYKLIKKKADGTWPDWDAAIKAQSNPVFTGLEAGDYRARIEYTKGAQSCHYPEDCIVITPEMGPPPPPVCNPPHTDPKEQTLVSGNGALRFFPGVVQLTCETPAASAEIVVANVSGGFNNSYEYNIDGGAWQSSNHFPDQAPGTHKVGVKNTGTPFCEAYQDVEVKQPIEKPQLPFELTYDCDGRARMKITTNKANYSYKVANTPGTLPSTPPAGNFTTSTVPVVDFPDLATTGNQTVRVFYKETAAPEPIVLIKEDFGTGSPVCGLPGVPSNWGCGTPDNHHYISGYNNGYLDSNGCWATPYDHTNPSPTSDGRFAFYNIGNVGGMGSGGILYEKHVKDIEPNQPIKYKLYLFNVVHIGCNIIRPNVEIRLVDSGGNVITSQSSGEIAPNNRNREEWHEFSGQLNPGTNTEFSIQIRSIAVGYSGNDLAIDDIYVYQEPKACPSSYIDITTQIAASASRRMKVSITQTTEETCYQANNGSAQAKVENYGNKDYKWRLVKAGTVTPILQQGTKNAERLDLQGLTRGNYSLYITANAAIKKFSDGQACDIKVDFVIVGHDKVTITQRGGASAHTYLDCGEGRRRILVVDGHKTSPDPSALFHVTGGKQPGTYNNYTIKVKDPAGAEETLPRDTDGKYWYTFSSEGDYQIRISDVNGCKDAAALYNYKVKKRVALSPIKAEFADCTNSSNTGIGPLKIKDAATGSTPTWAATRDYTSTLQYQWKKKSEPDTAWSAPSTSDVIDAPTVNGWEKGVVYVIRAKDEYNCGQEIEVTISPEINNLAQANYTVTQPTAACGSSLATQGKITVDVVRGGSPAATYHYAFVHRTNATDPKIAPDDTDYSGSNFKSGLTPGYWDVYIKDVNTSPRTCGKLVTGATGIKIESPVAPDFDKDGNGVLDIKNYSATCENGQGGKLVIKRFKGKGPFKLVLTHLTDNTQQVRRIPRAHDPANKVYLDAPTPPSNIGVLRVEDYTFENLEADPTPNNYKIEIIDEGNASCAILGATGRTFTIAQMEFVKPSGGWVTQTQPDCADTTMGFGLKATHTATIGNYRVVYRVVRQDGNLVSGAWRNETDHPIPTAPKNYVAQGLVGAFMGDTYPIGARIVAEIGLEDLDTGNILCRKELPEFTLHSTPTGFEVTPQVYNNCQYDLQVKFGLAADQIQFFLNHDGAVAEDQTALITGYTAGNLVTFPNHLTKGRSYTVYVHYKLTATSPLCKASIEVPAVAGVNTPAIQIDEAESTWAACGTVNTPMDVTFTLKVSGTPLTYKIYEKDTNGAPMTPALQTAPMPAPMPGTTNVYQLTLTAQTVPATGKQYIVSFSNGSCESMNKDMRVTPPATPLGPATGTFTVVANKTKPISCEDGKGQITIAAGSVSGGEGPFTFRLSKEKNPFLRKNFVKRNISAPVANAEVGFDLKETDFDTSYRPTHLAAATDFWKEVFPSLTFTLEIIDQKTNCTVTRTASGNALGHLINSKHKAKYSIAIVNHSTADACDNGNDQYRLKITLSDINATITPVPPTPPYSAGVATPTDYEYSIDGGVTYRTFPTTGIAEEDIPTFFDHEKIKVRYKDSKCEATIVPPTPPAALPGTGQRLTYPKLAFTVTKGSDMVCETSSTYVVKLNLKLTSGTDFVQSPMLPPAVVGGGNRYDIIVTRSTSSAAQTRTATVPAPHMTLATAPTDNHTQELKVTLPPPVSGESTYYYTVWVKDKGNGDGATNYCGDYLPSAPIEVLPAEAESDLIARHQVDRTKLTDVKSCTAGAATGSFEFTRTTTPPAREDVDFEYALEWDPNTSGGSYTEIGTIDNSNIVPDNTPNTVRYRVTGLKKGAYRIKIKRSASGSCGWVDVTNETIGRIVINEHGQLSKDTSSIPSGIELAQMTCDDTTVTPPALQPQSGYAQLRVHVVGGVAPYTFRVKDASAGSVIAEATVNALPQIPPVTYPAFADDKANHTFQLPDKGRDYDVLVEITDANGCTLTIPATQIGKIKTLHKITGATAVREKPEHRMTCNPTSTEKVKIKLTYTKAGGNTNGYNVLLQKVVGGTPTPSNGISPYIGLRTVADIPGSGEGYIDIPHDSDDMADYRITLFDKDTKCSYILTDDYRMYKTQKPRANLVLVQTCNSTQSPTSATVTFRVEVDGGDYSQYGGYNYKITTGSPAITVLAKTAINAPSDEAEVTLTAAQLPILTPTQFDVEVEVVGTGCKATSSTMVTRPNPIAANTAMTHPMTYCDRTPNNDGEITVTNNPTGGWGAPYLYRLVSGGTPVGEFTNSTTFGGLGVGSHYIQVKDAQNCIANLSTYDFIEYDPNIMDIRTPNPPQAKVPTCVGEQNGEIFLTGVAGGEIPAGTPAPGGHTAAEVQGKLMYALYDAETDAFLGVTLPDDNPGTRGTVTFKNLGAGSYKIRIYTELSCTDTYKEVGPVQVPDPGSIVVRARLTKYPGCTVAGDLVADIDPRPNIDPSRGTYVAQLYEVTGSPQLMGTGVITGTYNTGVTATFAGVITPGTTDDKQYQVFVKDDNGSSAACEGKSNIVFVDKVTAIAPTLVADKSQLSLKCNGSSYGKITVTATGGKQDEPYSFLLKMQDGSAATTSSTNPNPQGVFEGLKAGVYKVEVSQLNGGCDTKSVENITITEETAYKVKYELEDVKCNGDKNGKITITMLPGGEQHRDGRQRKLTYAISPRLDRFLDKPGGVIDSLAPGKYFVIVQDENGCRPNEIFEKDNTTATGLDIIEFTIGEPEPLSVTVNPEATQHESCIDAKDGKTRLRVFGGTPVSTDPITHDKVYQLIIDSNAPIAYHTKDSGDLLEGLSAGEHTFRIIDKNGCEAETAVTIDPGSEVKLKLSAGKYECVDGKIKWIVEASVTPTTAALNVRYLLTEVGNPAKVDQPHDNTQFNLDVDLQSNTTKTYIISVLHKVAGHGECRVDSDPIQVAPKEPLTIEPLSGKPTVSCHDGEDGRFEITARGGSSKYNYGLKKADGTFDWQGDNNKFTGLKVGSYTVGVKDMEYNCIAELTNIVVESPDKIAIKQQSIQHVGCKGETNGKISYAIEGGNTPYKWEVYKEDGTTTSKRGTGVRVAVPFEITDLAAGKYMIRVTDAKDCEASKEFEIIEGVDLGGRIVQSYDCHASIDENNKVLVVAGGRGANSDTAAEGTYDVYVSVNTPYLVVNPSARGAANRLRYAIGVEGGTTPIQRYEFEGTTPEGSDNTHNMYQIKHASLIPKLNAARALQEGLNQYKIYLYYFDKDNPAMSDAPLCESVRDLNIEYYPPVKITNTSISNDLNLLKVKVEGGKERYTVYFCSAQYHTAEEAKSHYVQKVEDVKAGDEVTYFVQKTDYEEENPDTGKVEKKIRVYVEDSKGELKEENGGKEACGHSVFLYKEFVDVVIPNFFTPNGDGQYDTWAPLNLASYPNAETVIYDRYGRKIATLNNKEEWDGTYGGEALPTGDYWFILRLNEPDDNRTFKGHFTLYR